MCLDYLDFAEEKKSTLAQLRPNLKPNIRPNSCRPRLNKLRWHFHRSRWSSPCQLRSSGAWRSKTLYFNTRLLITGFFSWGNGHNSTAVYVCNMGMIDCVHYVSERGGWHNLIRNINRDINCTVTCAYSIFFMLLKFKYIYIYIAFSCTMIPPVAKTRHTEMHPMPLYMPSPCEHPWPRVIQRPQRSTSLTTQALSLDLPAS